MAQTGSAGQAGRETAHKTGSRAEMRAETRRLILEAAELVFAEAGFGGATMQAIAARAGLPKANLHYYFATKEKLYREVVARIFEVWLRAADALDSGAPPAEALSAYIAQKMRLSRQYRHGSKVWAAEVMHGAPIIQDYLETRLRDWTEGRIGVIQGWIERGEIQPLDPRWLLYMIWSSTQHYADFAHQIETLNGGPLSEADWEAATQSTCAIILRGIGLDLPEGLALAAPPADSRG